MRLDQSWRPRLEAQVRRQLPAMRDLERGLYSADDFLTSRPTTTSRRTTTTAAFGSFLTPVPQGQSLLMWTEDDAGRVEVSTSALFPPNDTSGYPEAPAGRVWSQILLTVSNSGQLPLDVGQVWVSLFADSGVEIQAERSCPEYPDQGQVLPGASVGVVRCFPIDPVDVQSGSVLITVEVDAGLFGFNETWFDVNVDRL